MVPPRFGVAGLTLDEVDEDELEPPHAAMNPALPATKPAFALFSRNWRRDIELMASAFSQTGEVGGARLRERRDTCSNETVCVRRQTKSVALSGGRKGGLVARLRTLPRVTRKAQPAKHSSVRVLCLGDAS
jgi:hypothetical protein